MNTMTRLELTVGPGGYATISEALEAIPYHTPATIVLAEGTYHERIFSDKEDLVIRGSGMEKSIVIQHVGALEMAPDGFKKGTFRTSTAFFSGERLELRDLSIVNDAGEGAEVGQAIALYLDVRQAYLSHVSVQSHQDTLFLAPLPAKEREERGFYGPRSSTPRLKSKVLVEDSMIEGDVDFIFGGADALFQDCRIVSNGKGYVSAPSGKKDDIGFVFSSCVFVSHACAPHSVYLMRPWRPEGKGTFISCTYGSHINSRGACPWEGREKEKKYTFHRYDEQKGEVVFNAFMTLWRKRGK